MPPPRPWKKGTSPEYTALTLEVQVCLDKQGRLWSVSEFQSDEDERLAATLPNAGLPQVAHALLTSALRREVYTEVFVQLSKDKDFLAVYVQADEEGKRAVEELLGNTSHDVMSKTIRKMGRDSAQEILMMLTTGITFD